MSYSPPRVPVPQSGSHNNGGPASDIDDIFGAPSSMASGMNGMNPPQPGPPQKKTSPTITMDDLGLGNSSNFPGGQSTDIDLMAMSPHKGINNNADSTSLDLSPQKRQGMTVNTGSGQVSTSVDQLFGGIGGGGEGEN
jgi:hypothetical protein